MRPLKIRISAFGPYAGSTEIDMTKLGRRGIYLITGDTGSGKTTIFDAICFALYGRASGDIRENSMLRSKYAEADTPTEVELRFENRGKIYNVRRNPEYMRPSKRGNGETKQAAEAQLILPDGSIVTKDRAVTDKIIEIIGVDRNQFAQIAMIAQGDFLKLLLADTKDRQKIFRDIFKTEYYQILQERLKFESNSLYREFEKIKNSLNQYASGIVCGENSIFRENVEMAKAGEMYSNEITELIAKLIDEDTKEVSAKQNELIYSEEELSKLNTIKNTLEDHIKMSKSYRLKIEKLEMLKLKEEKYEAVLNAEQEKKTEYELREKKLTEIELQFGDYDRLDNISKNINIAEDKLKAAENNAVKAEKCIYECTELTELLKKELSEKQNSGEEKQRLAAEQNIKREEQKKLNNVISSISNVNSLYKMLKQAQNNYLEVRELAAEKQKEYEEAYRAFLDNQAGILAKELIEGKPCPVCGSITHPKRARAAANACSEEEINKIKEELDILMKKASDKSGKASEINGRYDAEVKMLKQLVKEEYEGLNNKELIEAVNNDGRRLASEINKIAELIQNADRNIERKKELEQLISKNELKLKNANKNKTEFAAEAAAEKSSIVQLQKQYEEIGSKVNYKSKLEAKKAAELIKIEINEYEERLMKAEKAVRDCLQEINLLNGSILELKAAMDKKPEQKNVSLDEINEKIKLISYKKESTENTIRTVHTRIIQNKNTLKNISDRLSDISDTERRLTIIKSLSDTANGSLGGKERIMLETYIQMNYFDRIIQKANLRLMVMTNGKYDLKRKETASNIRSQSGLDLDVIDHYNGTVRSVKTLSGGESFMASLALALGLSDEVMSSAGGIRLDTLFVDEGFGSLDAESLQQAMRALSSLADGDRLVGIISHVSELREKIDNKIIVTKDKMGGSRLRIECG